MSRLVRRFAADETGASAIEYGLVASLIAVAIIGGARYARDQSPRQGERDRGGDRDAGTDAGRD